MEYIGKCVCGKHNIIDSKRRIKPKSRPIQRFAKCLTCRKRIKQTIIGEVVKRTAKPNALTIRYFK